MEDAEIIISGPEYSHSECLGSLAEILIPKLKSHEKDLFVQVNCDENDTKITSYEFLRKSLEITEGLVEFGLREGDVVIFACSNSIRTLTAAFGILLSGGVLAPVDQTLKSFELQHFIKEFKPKYIICESAKGKEIQACAKFANLDVKIILIDSSVSDSNGEFFCLEDIRTKVDVDNYIPRKVEDPKKSLALISCSSGSTGMPKGVALSHYSILLNLLLTEDTITPDTFESFLLTSPLFWISGTIFIITSCYFGITGYIPKSTASEDLLKGIETSKTICFLCGPSTLLSLVEHPKFKNYDVSSVKVIFSAGSILSSTVSAKIKKSWKGILLINCYGLTETCGSVTSGSAAETESAVGKILTEAKVKVVDVDTEKSLGPNKVGECRVKTKKLMNGYYNNEEATKAAFDEKGWFRTGDLVYYDEDGVFYVVGRIKEIIKYQNYQISPVEIESYIIGMPGVKDVAVVTVPKHSDSNCLRALVVKDPTFVISAQDIIKGVEENFSKRKHLSEGVQFVDALPRSEVGKLKRVEAQKMVKI